MSSTQRSGGKRPWLLLSVGAVGVALAIFRGAGMMADARDSARPAPEPTIPLVELTEAQPADEIFVVEEGFIRPRAEIDVVPEISGKVVEVAPALKPGGQFQKGEMLFRIDPRTYEGNLTRAKADLQAAEAELQRAEADAARQNRLADIGATAESARQAASAALATARSRIGQSEAALILARKQMEDTIVSAPFDAAVISENVALGGFLQPGMAAATIFDRSAGEIVQGPRSMSSTA